MIAVTEQALSELCQKMGIYRDDLNYLGGGRGDSDGIAYTYMDGTAKKVLKILAIPEAEKNSLDKLVTRIRYAGFLGENGIPLAYPVRLNDGNHYVTSLDNGHYYTAYVMDFFEGRNPESAELTAEILYNWGKLIGKTHAVTKQFSFEDKECEFGFRSEIDFFRGWCKEPVIQDAWLAMKQKLEGLPQGNQDYGFIHNDNHQRNILVNGTDIRLIDFDCASTQFFIQDITTPVQGILFDLTGGMFSPCRDLDKVKWFFEHFLNGYETENHLADRWYQEIPTFINYRRMLLFTCMQDYVNTQPELKKGFIENILNPQSFQ